MLPSLRQEKILEIIDKEGCVQVDDLARVLNVSSMTIRRDLDKLHREDKLKRQHGGAVAKEEVAYSIKQVENITSKREIAEKASSFVKEGDTVFLDAGTTTYEIGKLICNIKNITIVTNDLEIALLVNGSSANLMMCGGRVQKSTGSVIDIYGKEMLEDIIFDVGFFGAASISLKGDVTTPTIEKMWLKKTAISRCERAYLTVDASKFNRKSAIRINGLEDYTAVITNLKNKLAKNEKITFINL